MSPFARLQLLLLLGNVAFIGAWAVALSRPPGWQWIGATLLAFFVAIRVGGMWIRARKFPDGGRSRRAVILSTAVAALAVFMWLYTAFRGPA